MAPFTVDNSMLSAFLTCTSKGWIRYGQHLTTAVERAELLSGKAGHTLLEALHRGVGARMAMAAFSQEYQTFGSQYVDPNERLAYHNVATILETFLDRMPSGSLEWRYTPHPDYIEVPFEVNLDEHGDFLYIGRIDLIGTYLNHYIVNENKFTGRISEDWKGTFRNDSQLSGYIYACRHGLIQGQPLHLPVMGAFVTAIELSKLPSDPNRRCHKHGMKYAQCSKEHVRWEIFGPLPREEQALQAWRADALAAAKRMRQVFEEAPTIEYAPQMAQEGTFTRACRFCEFQRVCETGRDPHGMLGKLTYSRWDPRLRIESSAR